uniref:Uncharacterized protein n=1 Tax=Schistocephalus solidus TaxID=70667 RepID=A0A0X3NUJ9_SCHSO
MPHPKFRLHIKPDFFGIRGKSMGIVSGSDSHVLFRYPFMVSILCLSSRSLLIEIYFYRQHAHKYHFCTNLITDHILLNIYTQKKIICLFIEGVANHEPL